MRGSATYPKVRCMIGYTNDQQLHHYFHLMTLDIQMHLLTSWHEHVQYIPSVMRGMLILVLHNGLKVDLSLHK